MKIFLWVVSLASASAMAGEITGHVSGVSDPQNVVVYVEKASGTFAPPSKHPVMDQQHMAFVPHVLPILTGSTVDFPNSDTVRHSVYSPSQAKNFNLGLYASGISKSMTFDVANAPAEVPLFCAIHTQLSGYIYVLQNPYFATPAADGSYVIKGVPPGKYALRAWHEKSNVPSKQITVTAGATSADFTMN